MLITAFSFNRVKLLKNMTTTTCPYTLLTRSELQKKMSNNFYLKAMQVLELFFFCKTYISLLQVFVEPSSLKLARYTLLTSFCLCAEMHNK